MPLNDVPLSTQNLQQTQAPIRNNFSTLDAVFSVDHADYGTMFQGNHNKITFPLQSSAPSFVAGQMGLYSFTYSPTASQDLFLVYPDMSSFPLTASDVTNTGPNSGGNGWFYHPSKFATTWGRATTTGGTITITYTSNPGGGISTFPGFAGDGSGNFVGFFNIIIQSATLPTTNYRLTNITLTTFTITSTDSNNLTFIWNVTGF